VNARRRRGHDIRKMMGVRVCAVRAASVTLAPAQHGGIGVAA